ncbi:protein kinase domain-containing protein [Saliterribacillus persicus]|uniref:Serine/threonine-protein kinase n=1 Tax=Saliterribacillus persicus TaxID=930114 RepID=A0A368XAU0_9BACI|nr:protein kinase [Saliterribacillus persicus]RCW63537.1 serine/threonine-protein kinase [Saliterribacillus persicus]
MEIRYITKIDIETILDRHNIKYQSICPFPKSGQKAVFKIICDPNPIILKIYNVTPYHTINQMEYVSHVDVDELKVQKNEEIRILTMIIAREVKASKKCPIFPKMIITKDIDEYRVNEHLYKYYFEELVDGITMNESSYYLEENSISQIAYFLDAALELVKKMWDKTYVHRDIKPNNIIIDGERVMFIDPGLAKSANDETLTRTGMAMGTPRYWAPEQQEIQSNYNWTFKTDLYPLGLIAIEMFLPELRRLSEDQLKDMQFVYKKWCEKDQFDKSKSFFRDIIVKLSAEKIFRRASSIEDIQKTLVEFKESD